MFGETACKSGRRRLSRRRRPRRHRRWRRRRRRGLRRQRSRDALFGRRSLVLFERRREGTTVGCVDIDFDDLRSLLSEGEERGRLGRLFLLAFFSFLLFAFDFDAAAAVGSPTNDARRSWNRAKKSVGYSYIIVQFYICHICLHPLKVKSGIINCHTGFLF